MTAHKISPHVQAWMDAVEKHEVEACEEQHLLMALVRKCFEEDDIYTDEVLLQKYLRQEVYFPFKLIPWEKFCIALHLCTFWTVSGLPRWPDLFLFGGRGFGKDAYISYESYCLLSPHSGLPEYDIDICANVEEQAMRPVKDVVSVLTNPQNRVKLSKYFKCTTESVTGIKFNGVMKGRTKSPASKDGMRSGMVVLNELHQYLNYDNIKVYITGLGKKMHPRRLYASTDGDVRDGPLDDMKELSGKVLRQEVPDNGMLPFICKLNNKKLVHDQRYWEQANPTLRYAPSLMAVIQKEYAEWLANPGANPDFMTKRMNLPQSAGDVAVTDYENIKATFIIIHPDGRKEKRVMPDLRGWACTCGIDYASITDFAGVNLRFRREELRYDINHAWLCLHSKDLARIKAPWQKWADDGHITLVDDVEIDPYMICEWIMRKGQDYMIKKWAIDNYRYALMKHALRSIGVDNKDFNNLKLVQPSDIMKVQPVIDSQFAKRVVIWGDQPHLRWATNNTKLVRAGKKFGTDTGNFYYAKIEGKSRKTDPFMALVASVVVEDELENAGGVYVDVPSITW